MILVCSQLILAICRVIIKELIVMEIENILEEAGFEIVEGYERY